MAEWISEEEAIARITIKTGISDPRALFENAVAEGRLVVRQFGRAVVPCAAPHSEMFRDAINLYAGGMTFVDIEGAYDASYPVEIGLESLKIWLSDLIDNAVSATRSPAGAKPKYDWDEYERVFAQKVAEIGEPDLQNEEGWRTKADVRRFLLDLAAKDNSFPSETQARDMASKFMSRIKRD